MTGPEWDYLANLLAVVQMAAYDVCEFIDGHMKSEIRRSLCNAVVPNYVEDAYHDVVVSVRRNMCQLKEVDLFQPWLARVIKSTARQYHTRMVPDTKRPKKKQSKPEKPKEIGAKTITLDGIKQLVHIFEPTPPKELPAARTPLFVPLSDDLNSGNSKPDCVKKLDVWSAMARLPRRWAKALRLRVVEGHTAEETAEIMDCSVERVHKLVQKAKQRMRELLPGYEDNCSATLQSRPCKAKRRARSKRVPLPVSDVLPHGIPIHIERRPRVRLGGFRGTAESGA